MATTTATKRKPPRPALAPSLSVRLEALSIDDRRDAAELLGAMNRAKDVGERRGLARALEEILAGETPAALPMPDALPTKSDGTNERLAAWLGDQVRTRREAKGWTQQELAERSGLAQPHLSRIERGQVFCNFRTRAKLAEAFGVPPARLDPAKAGRKPS